MWTGNTPWLPSVLSKAGTKWEEGTIGYVSVPQAAETGYGAGARKAIPAGWTGPKGRTGSPC